MAVFTSVSRTIKKTFTELEMRSMAELNRIGLQEAITALRSELIESVVASQGEQLRFEVGEITMEFQIEVERRARFKNA